MSTRTTQRQTATNRYCGQLLRQIRHGKGEYIYENRFFKYNGQWENGTKQGHGKLTLGDGGYYEGSFVNGEIQGHGYRVFGLTGATYSGQFHQGEMHGQGILCTADGCQYEGSFVDNKKEGEGILTEPDGSVYEGSFYFNKQHGEGTKLFSNGDKYEGNWVCGKRQGHGELTCADGTTYEGQWCNDVFHGEGTLIHFSGVRYSGLWINGRPEVESAFVRCAFKGTKQHLSVHQGDRFSVHLECCTSKGEVNISDNGRTLKISVWVKNLLETDVNSRYQGQRRSSLNQGKLSQFSVVQPIDLFKREAAFNTPMGYAVYPYEILHESSLGTRCQSEELESYSKPSLENTQQLPVTVITAPSLMDGNKQDTVGTSDVTNTTMQGLESKSFSPNLMKPGQVANLQAQSFVCQGSPATSDCDVPEQKGVPVQPVHSTDGLAVFTELFLPPPPQPELLSPVGARKSKEDLSEASEASLLVQKPTSKKVHKGSPNKHLASLQPKREKYCRPGEYVLMIEDITEPPYSNYRLSPYFIPLTILPQQ